MKRHFSLLTVTLLAGTFLVMIPVRAEKLSASNLDQFDRLGLFSPAFKIAVHDLVDTKQAVVAVKKEEKDISGQIPALKQQVDEAQQKIAALKQQLAEYDHSDQSDFAELQKMMANAGSKPGDVIIMVQAYLWAYPASPHQPEVQQFLQEAQKKISDQIQADKDAAAARAADRAKLLVRVQAKDLSLDEWRDFLRDLSQEEVIKYLGRPDSRTNDFWTYSGAWTLDPLTQQKIGLQLNFEAGRVKSVSKAPKS